MDSYSRTREIENNRIATTAELKRLVRKGCRTKRARAEAIARAAIPPSPSREGEGR